MPGLVVLIGVLGILAGSTFAQYGTYDQPPAGGSDVKTQLRTAVVHANNAAGSESIRNVQSHLTHVVNCLEGPRGRNYAQAELNPCQGQGSGILVDLRSAPGGAAWMAVVEATDDLALKGAKMTDITAARNVARGVGALLSTVGESLR
ncbi:MAG: hypothetical protein HY355_05830 [Armatimonadetes bacterium]|nr:hypothetical protein [Armatimonadota bacterium]